MFKEELHDDSSEVIEDPADDSNSADEEVINWDYSYEINLLNLSTGWTGFVVKAARKHDRKWTLGSGWNSKTTR